MGSLCPLHNQGTRRVVGVRGNKISSRAQGQEKHPLGTAGLGGWLLAPREAFPSPSCPHHDQGSTASKRWQRWIEQGCPPPSCKSAAGHDTVAGTGQPRLCFRGQESVPGQLNTQAGCTVLHETHATPRVNPGCAPEELMHWVPGWRRGGRALALMEAAGPVSLHCSPGQQRAVGAGPGHLSTPQNPQKA